MRAMPDHPPRLVLDTNVALDLFVFRDAGSDHVRAALESGQVQLVVDEVCRDEWLAVLEYPALRLAADVRATAMRDFDRCAQRVHALAMPEGIRLPRCADPDDQKFLELACAAGAQWLLSKDKAVLQLARRTAREGWFQILLPSAWRPPFTPA
ncbi:PIN domain-containing protein [Dyella sp. ASV21]|uniref:PIN domain-containing protein n=1 Tax=Dyella sp. ASV21 TaxID=2795114 RepID=UPI0018EB8445|nr:PIN domain-containing protein [Dyella sp. ASV21]